VPTAKTSPAIAQARQEAAELSGGTSGKAIYDAIMQAVQEFDLIGTVLDFGAGTGTLTQRLLDSERFTSVAAADLMAPPEGLKVRWIQADLNDSLPIPDAKFDVVISAEVIEHLENPRATAREIFRLLKPGGVAILSTPNNESWRSLISLTLRGHHVAFCDGSYPAHITALLRKDLERVLMEAGFSSPVFRFSGYGGLPGKPTLSWQRISRGKLKGLRFSDNTVVVAEKPKGEARSW